MPEPRDGGVKTLAIRLEDELHARLSFVAQVEGLGITDAIRQAIESYIENKHGESDFAERAAVMLDELDRQAALRRAQIEELLGKNNKPKGRPRRGEEPTA